MSNYGPVDIVWWDFSSKDFQGDEAWRATDLVREVRAKQPQIIMDNRLFSAATVSPSDEHKAFTTDHGDFTTPEQHIPATGIPGVDWETCMTLNTTWGYSQHDHKWKNSKEIIQYLVDIASKGGNFLLNIGPKGDGSIPQESATCMTEVGQWMAANAESIRGTTASTLGKPDFDGRITTKGKTRYLHVFSRPENGSITLPIQATKATLLVGGKSLTLQSTPSQATIQLPAELPDPVATVIRLE